MVKKKKTPKTKKIAQTVDELEIEEEPEKEDKGKTDGYEEHGCEFLNEAECEEELEEDSLDLEEVEKEHFDSEEKEE